MFASAQTPSKRETLYVHPGHSQCRIYSMPYHMRPGQSPRDIRDEFQGDWREVGMLDAQLRVRYLAKEYQHLRKDLEGLMGGTYIELLDGKPVS